MTPARAAEVLRGGKATAYDRVTAEVRGADALELLRWLFGDTPDGWLRLGRLYLSRKWGGHGPFLDYCKAEWEKERRA
jgi:hypothetical protein